MPIAKDISIEDGVITFPYWQLANNSHSNAVALTRSDGEGNYGAWIGTMQNSREALVETRDHAEKLIEALQLAIKEGWLFTEGEIDELRVRCTDTRANLEQRRAWASEGRKGEPASG